jgi:hypothetical protein
MFVSLDLMLLPNMTGSHVNLSSGNHLGGRKACVELNKNLMLSCLRQFNYVLLCSVLIFRSPPCWLQTLWLPLLAIPPLLSVCSYNPICATWKFTLGVCSVMVLWFAFYSVMTKPRASLWLTDTWLCCWARAGIEIASHGPLWNYIDVFFLVGCFHGYLSLSYQKIHISDQK